MKKRLLIPLAVAAVGAAVVGVVYLDSGAAVNEPQTAKTRATLQDEAAYSNLTDKLYGTAQQRRRASTFVTNTYTAGMTACMAEAKFQYAAPPAADFAVQVAPGDLDLLAPLGDFAQARIAQAKAEALQAYLAAGGNPGFRKAQLEGKEAEYQAAVNNCTTKESGKPYINADNPTDLAASRGDAQLSRQMFDTVTTFEKRAADLQTLPTGQQLLAGYRACLSEHGFAAKSWFDLHEQIASKFAVMNLPWNQLRQTTDWTVAAKFEQGAEAADRTCRTTLRSWAIARLRPVVDSYNADLTVEAMARSWQDIEHAATPPT